MKRLIILITALFAFVSCGPNSSFPEDVPTDSPPTILRIDPSSGPVGTKVNVFGFGFSYLSPTNVVMMGGKSIMAEGYELLENPINDEIESIEFEIPDGLIPKEYTIVVMVHETPSNSDIKFEVTP